MEKELRQMQERYWNGLSNQYQKIMQISLEDFHYGPQIPGESALKLLPPLKKGMKALELGAGGAQNSIYLAKQGLLCTAFDISENQLRHAKKNANKAGVDISFECTPIERFLNHTDGKYELIHSSHAFEFIENPAKTILECASVLAPDGSLVISTVHPLYNGDWVENLDEDGNPDGMGLFLKNYFTPPDDIRYKRGKVDVISRAYPVSAWFNWFRAAGLEVTAISEPVGLPATETPPYTNEDWADTEGELEAIPGTLIVVGRLK